MLSALFACTPAPNRVDIAPTADGISLHATGEIHAVRVHDAAGLPVVERRLPSPSDTLTLSLPWVAGDAWTVAVDTDRGTVELTAHAPADVGPVSVEVQAPLGQTGVGLPSDGVARFPLITGGSAQVALVVTVHAPGPVRLTLGEETLDAPAPVVGERLLLMARVSGPVVATVDANGTLWRGRVAPIPLSEADALAQLRIVSSHFPADALGAPDIARAAGRVDLPAPWWRLVLDKTPLGFRPRDTHVPWAFRSITVENTGEEAINVALRAAVFEPSGDPAPPFRPRVRNADDGTGQVSALLRVPAQSTATAALPVYVDEDALPAHAQFESRISLAALGSDQPLQEISEPLYVDRGSNLASGGLVGALGLSVAGTALVLTRTRKWLATAATSELVTISLFGTLTFVAGAAAQLVGMGFAAVLGPFGVLLTGLLDDAVATTLLATLITLLPRRGTLALAMLVGWMLRALALGGLSPVGLLFLVAHIATLEGAAWMTGVSAPNGRWRDGPPIARWARLSLVFAGSGGIAQLVGLAFGMALLRLYYAPWYAALLVALPGVLYAAIACAAAVPFAAALRRVEA